MSQIAAPPELAPSDKKRRETELWLIARQHLAIILDPDNELVEWEDLPGLTEDEFEIVRQHIGFVGEQAQGDVDRWDKATSANARRWADIWSEATP